MKVMMLSAGFGERMLPLTAGMPKPAIPVLGQPMAVQIVRWLARCNPERIVLNLHHLPELLEDLLGDGSDFGFPPIAYSQEETILGTAGGLRNARALLDGSGPIVVTNSDFLADIDLAAAIATHEASGRLATLVLTDHRAAYSKVTVDSDSRVLSLAGKPEADPAEIARTCLFTGCQVISREVFDRIPAEGASDLVTHVYRDLARERQLGAYVHEGFWWEFGSPELYLQGSMILLDEGFKERRRITDHDPARRLGRQALAAIGPGARYDPRSKFRGHLALGFASHVSEGCDIENAIVMPEAWIGPGCRLHCSIIGPGVELPAGFDAERLLVCRDPGSQMPVGGNSRREGNLLIRELNAAAAAH